MYYVHNSLNFYTPKSMLYFKDKGQLIDGYNFLSFCVDLPKEKMSHDEDIVTHGYKHGCHLFA